MDYMKMSIQAVAKLLREGEVTSEQLTMQALENIEKQGHLNAIISQNSDALKQAKAVDKMLKEGKDLPLLAGIPITIKDNINIKGLNTTCASKFLQNYVAPYDATIIESLNDNYAVIIGKTNLDEFSVGNSTESSVYSATLNPHNNNYVAGGSSGGCACAVASRQCFASVGSDGGGDNRQPSSFCGVVGLKPTYGLVSRYGIISLSSSMEQAGPITKTVKDSAVMLNVLSGFDSKEQTSEKLEKQDYLTSFTGSVKGVKIAIIKELHNNLNAEIKDGINKVSEFYVSKGAEVVEVSVPSITSASACYKVLSSAEAASNFAKFDGIKYGFNSGEHKNLNELYLNNRQVFSKGVKHCIMFGNYVLSSKHYEAYYKKAKGVQRVISNEIDKLFEKCDVILTATCGSFPFKLGEVNADCNDYTSFAGVAQLPAISVPCGINSDGLPMGMQLVGKKFSEKLLFNVADVYETQKEQS